MNKVIMRCFYETILYIRVFYAFLCFTRLLVHGSIVDKSNYKVEMEDCFMCFYF